MKLLKPFVLLSLFTSAVFSQVIIREKVEIVPHLSTLAAQGGGEVEVALRMSGNVDLVNRKPFVSVWNTYCGLYQSSGGPTVNIPALTGLHNVNAGFSTLGEVSYLLQVSVGTDVILADSGVAPANVTVRLTPQFTLTSGVEISFSSPIFHGEQTLAIVKNRPFTWCSTPVWHSGMKVTLEIAGKRGLGILTTGPGVESDSALTVKGTELASVKFIANGRQPVGGEESIVIQARVNGELIGSSTVKVVGTTVPPVIELALERATLLPTLTSTPSANEGNSNVTRVLVKVTQEGQPAADQQIELKAEPILPSGGHENHPEFPQDPKGVFSWNGTTGNPLVVTTNTQGQVDNLEYTTGEFSMLMKFTTQHPSSGAKAEIQKQISVPPLKQLSSGSFNLKPIENPVQKKHPSPYWVVPGIDVSLDLIASEYNAMFPGGPRITVTDVSLQYGGRYEINGNWTHTRHKYHRRGLDVDLRSKTIIDDTYIDTNNNGKYDIGEPLSKDNNKNGKLDLNRKEFNKILKPLVPKFELEDPEGDNEHYHLYFWR